jgi:hypothetical protein
MNRHSLLAVVLLIMTAWFVRYDVCAQTDDRIQHEARLQELLRQKRDALKERLELLKSMYDLGTEHHEQVALARDALLLAELDLAASQAQRVKICQQRIENYRSLEELATEQWRSGAVSSDAKLSATIRRIQAEIDCLGEQTKSE